MRTDKRESTTIFERKKSFIMDSLMTQEMMAVVAYIG